MIWLHTESIRARDIFCRYRLVPYIFLGIVCAVLYAGWYVHGPKWGIDFVGGSFITARVKKNHSMAQIRAKFKNSDIDDVFLQQVHMVPSVSSDWILHIQTSMSGSCLDKIQRILGDDALVLKSESLGGRISSELWMQSIMAVCGALLGISMYIAFRFGWPFAMCACAALLHDCLAVIAFLIWNRCSISESSVVALLITASYSINDTVIIFDRIRELLSSPESKSMNIKEIIEKSIHKTLSRTILTSVTTLIALIILYIWGGDVIADFSAPMIVGIFMGTVSSLWIAGPLLVWFSSYLRKANA